MAYYAMSDWYKAMKEEDPIVLPPDNDEDQGPGGVGIDPPAGSPGELDPPTPEQLDPTPGPSSQPETPALQTGFAGLRKGFLLKKAKRK